MMVQTILTTMTIPVLSATLPKVSGISVYDIVILIIALLALIFSALNFFMISKLRKIQEVELMNQKEDLDLSIKDLKGNLSRELKFVRKEISKNKGTKPEVKSTKTPITLEKKVSEPETKSEHEPKKVVHKKPYSKKRYYPKKRQNTGSDSNENK